MSSRESKSEQRAHSRIKCCLPCEVRIGEVSSPGLLLELSMGGALITSGCIPQRGDTVSISTVMPKSEKSINLHGRIVRVARDVSGRHKDYYRFAMRSYSVTPESMLLFKALHNK